MGRFLDLAAKAESVVLRVKSKDLTVKNDEVYADSAPSLRASAVSEVACAKSVESAKSDSTAPGFTDEDVTKTEATLPDPGGAKSVESAKSTLDDGSWTEDDIAWTEAALSKYYGCEIKLYDHWRDVPVSHVSEANDRIIVPTGHGYGQERKGQVRQETLWSAGHHEEGLEAA
jgi:hypothetical protein